MVIATPHTNLNVPPDQIAVLQFKAYPWLQLFFTHGIFEIPAGVTLKAQQN
jgi:hypothetical protein|tara:strand:- start:2445 stop:2597 length:153 start_codon:yes stop_codon:yes gene_type:complete